MGCRRRRAVRRSGTPEQHGGVLDEADTVAAAALGAVLRDRRSRPRSRPWLSARRSEMTSGRSIIAGQRSLARNLGRPSPIQSLYSCGLGFLLRVARKPELDVGPTPDKEARLQRSRAEAHLDLRGGR